MIDFSEDLKVYMREIAAEGDRLMNEKDTSLLEEISNSDHPDYQLAALDGMIAHNYEMQPAAINVVKALKMANVSAKQAAIFLNALMLMEEKNT